MTSMSSAFAQIECSDQPLDLSFHPQKPSVVAAALVDGTVEVHDAEELLQAVNKNKDNDKDDDEDDIDDDDDDEEIDSIVSSTPVHTQQLANDKTASGRAVLFSKDGTRLYTAGSAGDLCVLQADQVVNFNPDSSSVVPYRIPNASLKPGQPIQVLYELLDENQNNSINLLASGDEAGCVRLWDVRLMNTAAKSSENKMSKYPHGCVQQWHVHSDYVSGFAYAPEKDHTLLSVSADGVLAVYDVRAALSKSDTRVAALPGQPRGLIRKSDPQDDELLSILVLKYGRKVVCGTAEGVLNVWSWNVWGDISDRYPGHAPSIDALVKIDEDTVLMGSSDGFVRVVQIMPDKILGVIGDHQGFPIEKLAFNADRSLVGSLTHDNYIRLWDARILRDDYNEEEKNSLPQMDTTTQATTLFSAQRRESDDEWDDMDEDNDDESKNDDDDDDEDMDDSDDSDDDDTDQQGNGRSNRKFKSESEKFFEDL